jgi:uncharacterized membrane protein YkgB
MSRRPGVPRAIVASIEAPLDAGLTLAQLATAAHRSAYHFARQFKAATGVRASMAIIFLLFGYQKWFEYEAQTWIPYISNRSLLSWMYPGFGIRGASWILGVSEWLFGALLFVGFKNEEHVPTRTV